MLDTTPVISNSDTTDAITRHRLETGLDVFFRPQSVAVIGATNRPGHVGRAVFWNLLSSPFGGTVYPVNPKRSAVLGVRAYPAISQVPERVDLAVVATPADSVPAVIQDCAATGVRGAVIISAGFRETGQRGIDLEKRILAIARETRMRIMGPNCLGVMCPATGLNASLSKGMPRRGNVALISQSGAICTSLLDWSVREQVGFSALLSTGSMIDVGWGALIDYLGDDPHTRSIIVYMESVGDARSFLSAAREVALSKPILVIKAGRTEQAAKAAASHTGSLAGSDAVLDAAFRRVGVLRIEELSDVFHMAEVLSRQPLPGGPRLTIVTNAGGPGVLATDALIKSGAELATLSDEIIHKLSGILPPHWSHTNPIDVIGDAGPDRYERTLEIVSEDPDSDGLLVIMTPQEMSQPAAIAQKVTRFAQLKDKPILTSWMGGETSQDGAAVLNGAGIPTFSFPDDATRAFHYMWNYSRNLRALYETPVATAFTPESHLKAADLIACVRQARRNLLTEFESKQVLNSYGIPTVESVLAETEQHAVDAASRLGYPVVLKLNSFTITHKSDVGGVKLSLPDEASVRSAFREIKTSVEATRGLEHFSGVTVQPMVTNEGFELLVGSIVDQQFGPVIVFGSGGHLVEVIQDRSIGLPPLNTTLARRLVEQTRICSALRGLRGRKGIDLDSLDQLLVRFGELIVEQRWIQQIDINPLLASSEGLLALDARIILHPADTDLSQVPEAAIRAYPCKYVQKTVLSDGTELTIHPIRPEDEPLIINFHATLSPESVYRRYFAILDLANRTRHERLTRICFNDYDREMALVAELQKPGEAPAIVAVARLIKSHRGPQAEVAVIVSDAFQRRGIGSKLTESLIRFARDERLDTLTASVLFENQPMQHLLEKQGFAFTSDLADGVLKGILHL